MCSSKNFEKKELPRKESVDVGKKNKDSEIKKVEKQEESKSQIAKPNIYDLSNPKEPYLHDRQEIKDKIE